MALKNSHICQKWPEKRPSGHPESNIESKDPITEKKRFLKASQIWPNLHSKNLLRVRNEFLSKKSKKEKQNFTHISRKMITRKRKCERT